MIQLLWCLVGVVGCVAAYFAVRLCLAVRGLFRSVEILEYRIESVRESVGNDEVWGATLFRPRKTLVERIGALEKALAGKKK